MSRWAQGRFNLKNPDKYLGNRTPIYRSSWELAFMTTCDENPYILKWANENIKIPYRNPFTGKYTIYVPDFFIAYLDKNGKQHNELIEVKPKNQSSFAEAKNSKKDKAYVVLNYAKWEAAHNWCKQNGITFRVINEDDIFHTGKRR